MCLFLFTTIDNSIFRDKYLSSTPSLALSNLKRFWIRFLLFSAPLWFQVTFGIFIGFSIFVIRLTSSDLVFFCQFISGFLFFFLFFFEEQSLGFLTHSFLTKLNWFKFYIFVNLGFLWSLIDFFFWLCSSFCCCFICNMR